MSTRIFKFNLNNNYGQCGGSLKQRGGAKFNQGDRVRTANGDLGTILKVADDNEFSMFLVAPGPHYVITMDDGNKKEYNGVINVPAGNGTYNYLVSEDKIEVNPTSPSVFGGLGGLVNGFLGTVTGSSPSSTSFNVGDKVLVNGEVILIKKKSTIKTTVVNKKGVVTNVSPDGKVTVSFSDSQVIVNGDQLSKDDDKTSDIFLPSTSATSEMPSPSPGKPNLVASKTSSAMNLGPVGVSETSSALNTQMQKPTGVSETSSAFNPPMRKSTGVSETSSAFYRDIPHKKTTSVTSSEDYYSVIPKVVSRKESNLTSLYAKIPMRKSANRQNGGFYNESMLGQYGGFNEERKIYSYADIPIRTKPTFN